MQNEQKMLDKIRLIATQSAADDEMVVAALERSGSSRIDAELLTSFVPLALGRLLIARIPACSGLSLPEVVEIRDVESSGVETFELKRIGIFVQATTVAKQALHKQALSGSQLLAVALRSPEVKIVNSILAAKASLAGFKGAAPVLLRLKPRWITEGA